MKEHHLRSWNLLSWCSRRLHEVDSRWLKSYSQAVIECSCTGQASTQVYLRSAWLQAWAFCRLGLSARGCQELLFWVRVLVVVADASASIFHRPLSSFALYRATFAPSLWVWECRQVGVWFLPCQWWRCRCRFWLPRFRTTLQLPIRWGLSSKSQYSDHGHLSRGNLPRVKIERLWMDPRDRRSCTWFGPF